MLPTSKTDSFYRISCPSPLLACPCFFIDSSCLSHAVFIPHELSIHGIRFASHGTDDPYSLNSNPKMPDARHGPYVSGLGYPPSMLDSLALSD